MPVLLSPQSRLLGLIIASTVLWTIDADSVAVDPSTHRVYFPLQNINRKPVLRIALPSDK